MHGLSSCWLHSSIHSGSTFHLLSCVSQAKWPFSNSNCSPESQSSLCAPAWKTPGCWDRFSAWSPDPSLSSPSASYCQRIFLDSQSGQLSSEKNSNSYYLQLKTHIVPSAPDQTGSYASCQTMQLPHPEPCPNQPGALVALCPCTFHCCCLKDLPFLDTSQSKKALSSRENGMCKMLFLLWCLFPLISGFCS